MAQDSWASGQACRDHQAITGQTGEVGREHKGFFSVTAASIFVKKEFSVGYLHPFGGFISVMGWA